MNAIGETGRSAIDEVFGGTAREVINSQQIDLIKMLLERGHNLNTYAHEYRGSLVSRPIFEMCIKPTSFR